MKNQIQSKAVKYLMDELTDSEKLDFENLVNESSENKIEYEKIKTIWNKSVLPISIPTQDLEKEWDQITDKIKEVSLDKPKRILDFGKSYSFILIPRLAYISLIVIVCTLIGYFVLNYKAEDPAVISILTNNEVKKITLSDNSIVFLNKKSKLEYEPGFNNSVRSVKLNGEAFFIIEHDKRPFEILTHNSKTSVLGTEFELWSRNNITKLFVLNGKVNFQSLSSGTENLTLTNGMRSYIQGTFNPTKPELLGIINPPGWLNNKLSFNKTTLEEICIDVESLFNTKIVILDDSLKQKTMTGTLDNNNLEKIITSVCLAVDIQFELNGDTYYIKSKKQ